MKKSMDILKEMAANNETIAALEKLTGEPGPAYIKMEECRAAGVRYADLPEEEKKAIKGQQEKHDLKICEYASEAKRLKLENLILRDNARRALFAEVVPTALEIFAKYAGKKYGPKTEEKIKAETESATGCRCYLSRAQYSGATEFNLIPARGPYNLFRYDDFVIRPKWEDGIEKFPLLSEDNKILPVSADSLHMWDCGQYCENPRALSLEILGMWEKVKAAYNTFSAAVNDYNSMLPGKMEKASAYNFKDCWRI